MWLSIDDWGIDRELLVQTGKDLERLNMYPYFDTAHYFVTCLAVRKDLGSSAVSFSRSHPLACWVSCMLMSFSGSFLSAILLGEPIISPLTRHDDLKLATFIWYIVFYCPFDVVFNMVNFFPVLCCFNVAKEIQRAQKISKGVSYAAKMYPQSFMVHFLIGLTKGAGSGVMKMLEQLVRGTWRPAEHELLRPSLTTKACVIAAGIFTLQLHSPVFFVSHHLIYLMVALMLIQLKLSTLIFGLKDPLAPVENFFCAVFMGGIGNALRRAQEATREYSSRKRVQIVAVPEKTRTVTKNNRKKTR